MGEQQIYHSHLQLQASFYFESYMHPLIGSFTVTKETLFPLYKQNTLTAFKTKCFALFPMLSSLKCTNCHLASVKKTVWHASSTQYMLNTGRNYLLLYLGTFIIFERTRTFFIWSMSTQYHLLHFCKMS